LHLFKKYLLQGIKLLAKSCVNVRLTETLKWIFAVEMVYFEEGKAEK
jgi:hypothetical protein